MTAAGKINASNVTTGDRIIVKARFDAEGHERITESATKTGEGVFVARVIGKTFRAAQGPYEARGKYVIETTAGSFEAAPIQTMWLAPEDNAGIKRAYAEAVAEDAHRAELAAAAAPAVEAGAAPAAPLALTETQIEENAAEAEELALAAAEAARDENEAPGGIYHGTAWASTSRALRTQMIGRVLRRPELTFDLPKLAPELISLEDLTLHSQACNVLPISSEHGEPEEIEMAQNLTHAEARTYALSNGETADLIALVSSIKPSDWVQATEAQPVGTVVYAYAMGELRRGVVVKNTPTKTLVALTTAAAAAPGGSVRVQTATELHTTVYVAPAPVAEPEPVAVEIEADEDLTLNSHGGKVDNMNNDASTEAQTATETPARETTGSSVVQLLEKVHARIRQNHPEIPSVVIVTGSGADLMGQKWGHFRPRGWMAKVAEEGAATHLDEMFMAGETLAKGARQVLQTMLHEAAHSLAQKRGEKDTSRQGRWHNKTFVKVAEELGLEYKPAQADKTIGFSAVTLTEATLAEYADLLAELDAEIHLTVRLPLWLGGAAGGDEDEGGENMPKAPKGEPKPNTNNVKCVCRCEEPNIIRMSRKVLDQAVVNCGDCDSLFSAA